MSARQRLPVSEGSKCSGLPPRVPPAVMIPQHLRRAIHHHLAEFVQTDGFVTILRQRIMEQNASEA